MSTLMPPPLPARQIQQQALQSPTTPTPTPGSCVSGGRIFNGNVEQGATFSAQITISVTDQNGVKTPVDISGNTMQYTAKPHQTDGTEIDDSDPRTLKIDWQETTTPTIGQTWLIIPAGTTQNMEAVPYDHQLRMVSPGTIVAPLFSGSLGVTAPVSSRFQ